MLISPYPNYLMPFKIWTPTNHLVQIVSLDISCPTLEFWVGKDCYTSVTCHGKLENYQDNGNRSSFFPFINPTGMLVLRQDIVLFLLPASLAN
ncbi:hypothetical protein TNIN_478491 [Trichonephila inaurata madagascariensis]|uniref:Uncharacterized protein n=1 Tax=Trichonephila inaurata madagascariensis TaxID=2747483 RepID=A0A8X6XNY5_9ARAC|nr:hypothetical protein TNIN_478491 [Trichonephila inaurata madagascariensis]